MLTGYDMFLRALDEYGFMPLGGSLPIVTLDSLAQFYFDGEDHDPWAWRMRLCTQKDGAYARLLFGKPTLVSPQWYGVFLRAFASDESLEERYARGECDPLTRRIGALFDVRPVWARHALLSEIGRREVKPSAFDRALTTLEREMRITVSGEAYRIAAIGAPCGWPSVEYMRTDCFLPPAWPSCALTREQAREKIVEKSLETAPSLTQRDIRRMLG